VGSGSVAWAETPDDGQEEPETEAHAAVDESFAVRRLRRWLAGMFGGTPEHDDEPPKHEPSD
jgi:hypothetical protein